MPNVQQPNNKKRTADKKVNYLSLGFGGILKNVKRD